MDSSMRYWTEKDPKARHSSLMSYTRRIEKAQAGRRARNAHRLGWYWQKQITSLDSMSWSMQQDLQVADNRENVIRSIIDAATAKISTSKPRPVFIAVGGDFSLQKRAEQLTLAIEGVFRTLRLYSLARNVFRDACIWGTGLIKWYADQHMRTVRCERVLVDDILVDHVDGKYGIPRNMIQALNVSRDVLRAKFSEKKHAEYIAGAALERRTADVEADIADPVTLYESWRLPSIPGGDDGMHCIYTTAGLLVSEPWEYDGFPFGVFRWKPAPLGWHGIGLVEELEKLQEAQDWIDGRIKRMLNIATVRLFVPKGSGVNQESLTNDPEFPLVEYAGAQPPIAAHDPGPAPEVLNERERNKAAMYENSGVSQLMAAAMKPAGLNSAVALREHKDTQSERFADVGQAWDEFFCDCARLACFAASHLGDAPVVVSTADGAGANRVKWSDVRMDTDEYQIQIQAANILPREPAGRKEAIMDLISMFPTAAPLLAKQLKGSDIDSAMNLVSAPIDAILCDIEQLDAGVPVMPEPYIDLNAAKTLVLSSYLAARSKRAPEEVLEAYRSYLIAIDSIQREAAMAAQMAAQAASPQMPPAGGMPPGMPPTQ